MRLPLDWTGTCGQVADALNDLIQMHEKMARELGGVSHAIEKKVRLATPSTRDDFRHVQTSAATR